MMEGHLLLVDDEPALIAVLQPVLKAAGCTVSVATDGNAAISGVVAQDPDVVLLDLGLPDMDGKDVIRIIRKSSQVPIIVISARHQQAEKIEALDEGADDYVNKPFEIGELMARIRAAVRRSQTFTANAEAFESGPLRVDFARRRVELMGAQIRLSPKEYMLLHALARNGGHVVTHKRLLHAGWGGSTSDLQYLRVYMGLLRQKLEENPSEPELIITEPGVGYRLIVQDQA
ncbi:response regulator transcription factor [Novosphingobium album (ex Liu et al. 2023)]|uniref:Response regulator transcription factor n=1 Tax=Novosphingobium album (ex Liu et al. 2023) TaxID=3031130 RepID=A0ABT5WXN7_9SPHN|nr:response regulator transcription factor [Novosphingobium album (ex Liu et al. 2023)]MDE8654649.1 response regulator transcription factor [Novosphingobium album (ex Liu et al. 2023)]